MDDKKQLIEKKDRSFYQKVNWLDVFTSCVICFSVIIVAAMWIKSASLENNDIIKMQDQIDVLQGDARIFQRFIDDVMELQKLVDRRVKRNVVTGTGSTTLAELISQLKGADGAQGLPGPQGIPGVPGKTGSPGNSGLPGPKGSPGEKGEQGPTGFTGSPGRDGLTPPPGLKGERGPAGANGAVGEKGQKGAVGPQGYPGAAAPPGRKGEVGAQGPQGPVGAKGAPGSTSRVTGSGATYVRWGRTDCPIGARSLYAGVAAGSGYKEMGGSAQYICLSKNSPQSPKVATSTWYSKVYPVNFQGPTGFMHQLHDMVANCVLCQSEIRTQKIMVPGQVYCPSGWNREYLGFLMTETNYYKIHYRTQYVCADQNSQGVAQPQTHRDERAAWFHTIVQCDYSGYPCQHWPKNQALQCVVCTK